jgi:hypothetical protein
MMKRPTANEYFFADKFFINNQINNLPKQPFEALKPHAFQKGLHIM